MLQQLLESKARPARRRGGMAASVVAHAALVGLAAVATGRAAAPREVREVMIPLPVAPPPAAPPVGRRAPAPATPSTGTPTLDPLPAPVLPTVGEIPTTLPPIDPGRPLVDADAFTRALGTAGPAGAGASAGSGDDAPATWETVERAVVPAPGHRPPRYPESLAAAGVEGRAVARFVVDTAGRVEPASVRIVDAAHPLFAESVRAALRVMRFRPAEAGGRRVRQLVEMPFDFVLTR